MSIESVNDQNSVKQIVQSQLKRKIDFYSYGIILKYR